MVAVAIRRDIEASPLRRQARLARDGRVASRLLALAASMSPVCRGTDSLTSLLRQITDGGMAPSFACCGLKDRKQEKRHGDAGYGKANP
jgi:hypothetical protein